MSTISGASCCPSDALGGNPLSDRSFAAGQPAEPAMLTGLIHDLRQPLSVIEMCADCLNLILPEDDPARQYLDVLRQQVEETSGILCETLRSLAPAYTVSHPEPASAPAASRPLTNAASAAVTY